MNTQPRWLVESPEDAGAAVRLVCIPHAGGAASMFHPWRAALRPAIAIAALQLPGREDRFRETPLNSLPEIVASIVTALSSLDERPLVLFGHSLGAVVGFEVARQLRREGRPGPAALFVSGRGAPHLPSRAQLIGHFSRGEVLRQIATLHGGVPAAIMADAGLRDMMARALKADVEALEGYSFEEERPLECAIVAVGGDADVWVNRSELEAWQRHTVGSFACRQFRGDHFYFRAPEIQKSLLAVVRETCRAVAPPGSPDFAF